MTRDFLNITAAVGSAPINDITIDPAKRRAVGLLNNAAITKELFAKDTSAAVTPTTILTYGGDLSWGVKPAPKKAKLIPVLVFSGDTSEVPEALEALGVQYTPFAMGNRGEGYAVEGKLRLGFLAKAGVIFPHSKNYCNMSDRGVE